MTYRRFVLTGVRIAGVIVGMMFITSTWWQADPSRPPDDWPSRAPAFSYVSASVALAVVAMLLGSTWKSRAVCFVVGLPVLVGCQYFLWPGRG